MYNVDNTEYRDQTIKDRLEIVIVNVFKFFLISNIHCSRSQQVDEKGN